jgi:hypothetical protein
MKHVFVAGALAGIVGLSAAAASSAAAPADLSVDQGATIQGCLFAGSATGEYLFSTGSERHTVVAGQGVDLAAHVNHRVELTGALEQGSAGQVFRATALKMVAPSCTAR